MHLLVTYCKKPFFSKVAFFSILFFLISFPQATHQTLLEKFKRHNEGNQYIEFPAVMEPAFIIHHYAGKVKYGVKVSAVKQFTLLYSLIGDY